MTYLEHSLSHQNIGGFVHFIALTIYKNESSFGNFIDILRNLLRDNPLFIVS